MQFVAEEELLSDAKLFTPGTLSKRLSAQMSENLAILTCETFCERHHPQILIPSDIRNPPWAVLEERRR